MKRIQPPTILHLVLIGFLVVLLPLLIGLVRSFESLGSMAKRHERDTSSIVLLTEESETIHGELIDLERAARQYQLLKEEELLGVFNDTYVSVRESLLKLSETNVDKVSPLAEIMIGEVDLMHPTINDLKAKPEAFKGELARFERLFFLAKTLRNEVSLFLNSRVNHAKDRAEKVSTELVAYAVTLIPLTIFLILIFMVLILKPLKQIDKAIRRLGEGEFNHRIDIQGPRDLQTVAKRLTWLGKQLAETNEEKMRFLRHISHELKTPLSTIKEATELLEDQIPGKLNQSQMEVLGILSKGVDSFQSLINNLLDFNLMTRENTLQKAHHSVSDLVQDTINAHLLTADRKNIGIKLRGAELTVNVDRSVIKAALDNLISNAVHYTPEGGYVEVSWDLVDAAEGETLVIAVKDTGPGIPTEEQEKVFLPFFQGTAKKQGPLKGTGLGLSVARECVESHQGELAILKSRIGAHLQIKLPQTTLCQEPI